MVKHKITLPECWKKLIDTEFPEDLEGIEDGDRVAHADEDPLPYYDDQRSLAFKLPDGSVLTVFLCSGQSNYWGSYDLMANNGNVLYESEPLESFCTIEVPGYEIEVEFRQTSHACECDNTHEQNDTVCRYCYSKGRRKPSDPE